MVLGIDWCCAVLYQTVQEQNDTICIRRNACESVNLLNRDSVCANLTRIQSTGSESCAMENTHMSVCSITTTALQLCVRLCVFNVLMRHVIRFASVQKDSEKTA